MALFLLEHMLGCTPIKPCLSCQAVAILHEKLDNSEINTLFGLARQAASPEGEDQDASSGNTVLARRLDEFELSPATTNALKGNEIVTLGDLICRTESEMLRIPGFGRRSLNEIKVVLQSLGLSFASSG